MKRFIGILSIAAAVGMVVFLTVLHGEPEENEIKSDVLQVNVIRIESQEITDIIIGHGQITPRWETTISSEVNGRVLSVSEKFLSGAEFSKDDVLATIDATAYIAALEETKATLARAKRTLQEEEQRSKIAVDNWKSSGFEGQPSELVLRKPQLEEAKVSIVSAEAAVKKAKYDLAQTKITVPYDGVVISRNINPGDFIQTGVEIGRIYDRKLYEVVIPLSLQEISRLSLGDQAQKITIKSKQSRETWSGFISRIEQIIDTQNRWQNVVIEIDNPEKLLPGVFVTAEFQGDKHSDVLAVPENMPSNDGYLWYVDEAGILQRFMPEIFFQKDGVIFVKSPFENAASLNLVIGQDAFLPGVKVQTNTTKNILNAMENKE